MTVNQYLLTDQSDLQARSNPEADLALCFGAKSIVGQPEIYAALSRSYPNARIAMASSGGEIFNTESHDDTMCVVVLSFERTSLEHCQVTVDDYSDSFQVGVELMSCLSLEDLQYVLVLSDGRKVNGSQLVKGIREIIPASVPVTGGLAGDGTTYESTLVGINETPSVGKVIAIGFYGTHLQVTHGSQSGWKPFGMKKVVTNSQGNELFELNGENALKAYRSYMGKHAEDLPGAALFFPLCIDLDGGTNCLIRGTVSVDPDRASIKFAGDVPVGSTVRFMMASTDRLVEAAGTAAADAQTGYQEAQPDFALLVSCVGRKKVLGTRIDEELEAVAEVIGSETPMAGFYSYGEISPISSGEGCELHNQTMTVTFLKEIE